MAVSTVNEGVRLDSADPHAGAPDGGAVRVQRFERSQIGEAADVLARSFVDEPSLTHAMGGTPRRRLRVLRPFFRGLIWGYWGIGEGHGAWIDERFVGVGLRIPPGLWPPRRWDRVRGVGGMLVGALPMLIALPGALRWFALEADQETRHPLDQKHWYLAWVGVHPAFRRRGVASALAEYVVEKADAAGVGCYVETYGDAIERLYRRYGFEVRETWDMPDGGPMGRSMWRRPQPRSAGQPQGAEDAR